MKHFKICIYLSTFLIFPLGVKADFSMMDSGSDPLFQNSGIGSINNSRKERTGFDNKWGMDVNSSIKVDLSKLGGRRPSC